MLMYSITQYENSKTRDLIDCTCDRCGQNFKRERLSIFVSIKRGQTALYCTKECFKEEKKRPIKHCKLCSKELTKRGTQFCNRSCAATYNNTGKIKNVTGKSGDRKNENKKCRKIEKEIVSKEMASFKCYHCGTEKVVTKTKMAQKSKNKRNFCSEKCYHENLRINHIKDKISCGMCGAEITSSRSLKKKLPKCGKYFCDKSCRMKYYNKFHSIAKTKNKSRPEELFVELIQTEFPQLRVLRNNREILKSGLELDIFFPEISLAIEINGPVHYLPIFGEERLNLVSSKDSRKMAEAYASGIELIVIDVSTWCSLKTQQGKSKEIFSETIKPILAAKIAARHL